MQEDPLEELLDRLVAEYSDRLAAGRPPDRASFLARVPEEHRGALERSLGMIELGFASAPARARPLGPGVALDGYRIVRELGRGGMAVVYLAEQAELQRRGALKVLRPALALEQRHVDRFRREALAIARLDHAHIVAIHSVGEALGHPYLAMEHVDGPTLADVLRALPERRPWTADDLARAAGIAALGAGVASYRAAVARLLSQVASALAAAHGVGIVHRDVKPSNVLLRRDGTAVVGDFGLAKGDGDPGLSLTGDAIGTPWYMSPEQAQVIETPIDHRTDVYSLGVTLYEALAGRRPYEGRTALAVLEAIRTAVPRALRAVSPETDAEADAVVRRAMARTPDQRYASMEALGRDLAALARGEPTRARADEGGPLRRALHRLAAWHTGATGEYRSPATLLGLPLVHVHFGRRPRGKWLRVARGWIAVGDVALGGVTLGGLSLGLVSLGSLAIGGLALGGLGIGLVGVGGLAAGALAIGGAAAGYVALGGAALGHYAIGGEASGTHVVSERVRDPVAVEWFQSNLGWLLEWIPGMERILTL